MGSYHAPLKFIVGDGFTGKSLINILIFKINLRETVIVDFLRYAQSGNKNTDRQRGICWPVSSFQADEADEPAVPERQNLGIVSPYTLLQTSMLLIVNIQDLNTHVLKYTADLQL